MVYLIYLIVLASVIFLVIGAGPFIKRRLSLSKININIEEGMNARQVKRPPVFKFLAFLLPFNKAIAGAMGRERIDDKLLVANVSLLPEDYIMVKEILLFIAVILVVALKDIFRGQEAIFSVIFIGMGYIIPDFWLKLRIKKRQAMIIKYLPDIIDLLSLCVNAGLDFSVAVQWVVEKSKPTPLIQELGLLLLETKVGKSRKQALTDMARRIALPEVSSFSRALIQAERLGTPMESALVILSEEVREYRFRRGERLALQAPIKLLFPLVFFIMPVVMVIVGGPIILQFLQTGLPGIK